MSVNSYIHKVLPGSLGGPLLFVFHGTGGDENQLIELGRDLLPESTIVAPRGDVSEFGAARFFRRTAEGVYDMDDLSRGTAKMVEFVRAHIDSAKPSHVIGLGYSNGANILASVVFLDGTLFDASVLLHPLIPFDPDIGDGLIGKRILITAGRRDPICPPGLTSRLMKNLLGAGADASVVWHDGGHELRPSEIVAARLFLGAAAKEGEK